MTTRPRAGNAPNDRLRALDRAISRCPLCGAWRRRGACPIDHGGAPDLVSSNG